MDSAAPPMAAFTLPSHWISAPISLKSCRTEVQSTGPPLERVTKVSFWRYTEVPWNWLFVRKLRNTVLGRARHASDLLWALDPKAEAPTTPGAPLFLTSAAT